MGAKADKDLSKTPIIIADVADQNSLLEMAKQTKIIVNCCGPYDQYGEQVVKACIEAGTHHVDVSGETNYMEKMQLKYSEDARTQGVFVISACGVESIPADVGAVYLQKNFNGTVNSIETFVRFFRTNKNINIGINYGTWESLLKLLIFEDEVKKINRELHKDSKNDLSPKLKKRGFVHRSSAVNDLWCIDLPYPDKQVLQRSQQYLFKNENQRPAQITSYLVLNSMLLAIFLSVMNFLSLFLLKFKFICDLLLNHPKFFSFGIVSRDGPEEKQSDNFNFELTCYAEGWKEKLAEPTDRFSKPCNKKMIVKVSAKNPAYGATCIAVLLSATTILKERSKMPEKGGVLPPGAAFKDTSIVEELQKNGFKFEIEQIN